MKKIFVTSVLVLVTIFGQAQTCPDNQHPHAIDLGLPSGIKWGCCNVGADTPETYGDYYAFGETEVKDIYNDKNYLLKNVTFHGGTSISAKNLTPQHDVANKKWGEEWHIPSPDQFNELKDNCTSEWKTVEGVNGQLFTGKNGNSIFIPAGGKILTLSNESEGKMGHYWLNTDCWGGNSKANYFFITSSSVGTFNGSKSQGLSVRPIKKEISKYR